MRGVIRSIWVAAIVAVVAGVSVQPGPSAAPSRIVDRTFACNPIAYGSVADLDIFAGPSRDDTFGRHFVALLEVRTGAGYMSDSSLVFVRARSEPKLAGLAYAWPVEGQAGVYAHSRRCVPTRVSVPLSTKGLAGPPVRWSKDLDCLLRGRVLVRVRAVLVAPDEWRRADRWYDGARKSVADASLAVRNQRTGAPIAFMQVDKAGKTRLWFSPSCS